MESICFDRLASSADELKSFWVELLAIPGLRIETWGTHNRSEIHNRRGRESL